jgi:quinol monooxygenase YgiN
MAIRVTLRMSVRPGADRAFQNAWLAVAEAVGRHPACLRQALIRDDRHPGTYDVTSDWDSREAFHAFETSDEQDRLTAPLRELRTSARLSIDEIVHHT